MAAAESRAGDAQDAGDTDKNLGKESEEIIKIAWCYRRCNRRAALESGLRRQIIISCKTSRPRD